MEIDYYNYITKGKKNIPCKINLKTGLIEEGIYQGENSGSNGLGMVIKMTGETLKRYENIGISDPNTDFTAGDSSEIKDKKISIPVLMITSIEFDA